MLAQSSRMLGRTLRSQVPKAAQVRLYHENIVEHYENPRNVGSFDKNDENVGTVSAKSLKEFKEGSTP